MARVTSASGVLRLVAVGIVLGVCSVSRVANAQFPIGSGVAPRSAVWAGLRPGQFVYETTMETGVSTTIIGTRTVTLTSATYAGTPTWLLSETRYGNGIAAADSLFLNLTSLEPLHWSSTLGEARVAAEFRNDTAYTGITSPMGRNSMVTGMPPGTLVNAAMLETFLRLQPLHVGWEDSTAMLSLTLGADRVLPTRISVIGDDRVRVPAGVFDCWVVGVHADAGRGLYWVTKQNPIVVRSTLDVPILGGAQLVNSLISASP